jgi:hypothetical protein
MKKLFSILMIAALVTPLFQSCKKGANDPAISFKSRDARITAKWKLTKIDASDITVTSGVTNSVINSYDGTTLTTTSTSSGSETSTGTYEMEIDKMGVMSWNETYTATGSSTPDVRSGTGTWEWLDSDKNKSVVDLVGGAHFFSNGLYNIDRLATKELVVFQSGNENNNGDTRTWNYKFTFEKE